MSLGAIHVHNDDAIIAVAVQPGSFHLRDCLRKTFPVARRTFRREITLGLPKVRAYRQGVQQAG